MLTPSPEVKNIMKGNGRIINFRANVDTPGGMVVKFGPRIGVVEAPAEGVVRAGKLGNIHLGDERVFKKATAVAFSFGDAVIYDNATETMVAAGANAPHGYVSEYAGAVAGSTEVSVILI